MDCNYNLDVIWMVETGDDANWERKRGGVSKPKRLQSGYFSIGKIHGVNVDFTPKYWYTYVSYTTSNEILSNFEIVQKERYWQKPSSLSSFFWGIVWRPKIFFGLKSEPRVGIAHWDWQDATPVFLLASHMEFRRAACRVFEGCARPWFWEIRVEDRWKKWHDSLKQDT